MPARGQDYAGMVWFGAAWCRKRAQPSSISACSAPVWIYRRGVTAGAAWTGQGLRFGIAIISLTIVPTYLIYYCVQPMPAVMVAKQIVFDGIGAVLVCLVAAWLHRDKTA